MGMSTHIVAYISDKDPTYQKHKAVLMACIEANIKELPKETAEYFGSRAPEQYLAEEKLEIEIPKEEWGDDYSQGYEIKMKDIPQGVHKIRFYNSH